MAILNYTTTIDSVQTIGEITRCLVKHGAKKIVSDYNDEGTPIQVTFMLPVGDSMVAYALPANYQGVMKTLEKSKEARKRGLCNEQQAVRVSWRIIKDWVEAQLAIVEANLAEMSEVFLPYAVTKSGETLYNSIKSNPKLILT